MAFGVDLDLMAIGQLDPEQSEPEVSLPIEESVDFLKAEVTSEAGLDPLQTEQWYYHNDGSWSRNDTQALFGADIQLPSPSDPGQPRDMTLLALIDSGVDWAHPDLNPEAFALNFGELGFDENQRQKALNGIDDDGNGYIDDWRGWNFADDSATVKDGLGHGTHLVGILAASKGNDLGIYSPWQGFKILPLQVFSSAHPSASSAKIAAAVRYAVGRGARVISLSFGSPTFLPELYDAISYAREHDVLVVNAAGNFRKDLEKEPDYPSRFGFDNQITVAASDHRDLLTSFSNFGKHIDISAPGFSILSLNLKGGYSYYSGTSQACPMVAAAAAMVRSYYPDWTAQQTKQALLRSADEVQGLLGITGNALRLNVANGIADSKGKRLDRHSYEFWEEINVSEVESLHPYRNLTRTRFRISMPQESSIFRIHFSAFKTLSTDVVTVFGNSSYPIIQYSGDLGEFWTPEIHGNAADVELVTDQFGMEWGFKVDKVAFCSEVNGYGCQKIGS